MAIGYYVCYEVTIRVRDGRQSTATFNTLDSTLSFIDDIVMDHLQNRDTKTVIIKDGWKIFIIPNEGPWYMITIMKIERQFMTIDDFLKSQNN